MNGNNEQVKCPKCAYRFIPRDKTLQADSTCPLCGLYGLEGKAVVCGHCRAFCRACGEGTANLKIVMRKGRGLSAICKRCFTDLTTKEVEKEKC